MIKQLREYLPTDVLDQIYKMHARSHLDYCDFIYHIPELRGRKRTTEDVTEEYSDDNFDSDDSFEDNNSDNILENDSDMKNLSCIRLNYQMRALESIQYQAGLAVTGAWKGSNTQKIYNELGWESLNHHRYFRRITQFLKIMNGIWFIQFLCHGVTSLVVILRMTCMNLVVEIIDSKILFTQIL